MESKYDILISYILSKSLLLGIFLSYIIKNTKEDCLYALIIGYFFGFIILNLIKKKDFHNLNNFIKYIYLIFINLLFIINILMYNNLVINLYLPKTPTLIITITFLLTIFYGASKKIDSYKRLIILLSFLSIILLLIPILFNVHNIDINNFKFISNINIEFIKTTLLITILSISPNILILNTINDIDKKKLIMGYLLSGISIFLLLLSTIGTLGVTLSSYYSNPLYIVFEKITTFGFIERIENILSFMWLIDIISLSILIIKSLKNILKDKLTYIITSIISILTIVILINNNLNLTLFYNIIIYLLTILLFIIILNTNKSKIK